MIKIHLKNLRFKCIIGLLECERIKKQKIKINLSLKADEFIDYAELAELLKAQMKKQKFYKIEDGLIFFKDFLKQKYPSLKLLKLQILKPQVFKLLTKTKKLKISNFKYLKTTPGASLKHIY